MVAEYTVAAVAVPVGVLVGELAVLRTGILRDVRYWLTVGLLLAFQIPVDGALTSGRPPVVEYRTAATSHVRLFWDTPIEDFGFGFALVTLTLMLWQWNRTPGYRRPRKHDA
jgi:lycopene cyclase domain-containing protein